MRTSNSVRAGLRKTVGKWNGCPAITRLSRQREASNRYQQRRAGRHKHAARTRQWGKRHATPRRTAPHRY